jgi:hypothetical protein
MNCGKKSAAAAMGEDRRTIETEIEKLFRAKRPPTKKPSQNIAEIEL